MGTSIRRPVTRISYDTEFFENGRIIDLISIALAADDGRELYAISSDLPFDRLQRSPWLMTHVAPSLPIKPYSSGGPWDRSHPDFVHVAAPRQIAEKVRTFVLETDSPQMWADHGAYDHVVLAQLFGPMSDLPSCLPMWTHELQQELERYGLTESDLPGQEFGHHNALADARHLRDQLAELDRLTGRPAVR